MPWYIPEPVEYSFMSALTAAISIAESFQEPILHLDHDHLLKHSTAISDEFQRLLRSYQTKAETLEITPMVLSKDHVGLITPRFPSEAWYTATLSGSCHIAM